MTQEPLAKKPWWRRWFGDRSERAAARFLQSRGFRILARNVSGPLGELDIVALDQDFLVFIEVRSTQTDDESRPALSIDREKQRRLTQLALDFMRRRRLLEHACRFDVLTLTWPLDQREPKITHYANAFEAVGRFQMDR